MTWTLPSRSRPRSRSCTSERSSPRELRRRSEGTRRCERGTSGRPMRDVLELSDIHTYYGDSYVLQGVSLNVGAGQVIALMGRNGVGKTTTIRSIVGFSPPKRGRITFKESDITRMPAHQIARNGISLVPQGRR